MKLWPGVTPTLGDNAPWNMFSLVSMGLTLNDAGSYSGTVPAGVLAYTIIENNDRVLGRHIGISEHFGGAPTFLEYYQCKRLRLNVDLSNMKAVHGLIIEMKNLDNLNSPGDNYSYHNMWHRVKPISGLWLHNTGSPYNVSLTSEPKLIDNYPDGAAAATITTQAIQFTAANTSYCEVGIQVGELFNGIYYPAVVEALALAINEPDDFKGIDVYVSWEGSIWYLLPKANYNAYDWVGGEAVINPFRDGETATAGQKGFIVSFGQPVLGNYFKIVKSNAGGKTFTINEIYALNKQGDIGFTTDLIHHRQAKASKAGNTMKFDLKNLPIMKAGLGPLDPAGNSAVFSTETGTWVSSQLSAFYNAEIGAWVRSTDGAVWSSEDESWLSTADYQSQYQLVAKTDIAISAVQSKETSSNCRRVDIEMLPWKADDSLSDGRWLVYEIGSYCDPTGLNTANNLGALKNTFIIKGTPGGTGAWVEIRMYNHTPDTTAGLTFWIDIDPQEAIDTSAPLYAMENKYTSQEISPIGGPGPWTTQLVDDKRSITACKTLLGANKTAIGSLGDSCLMLISRHLTDDLVNTIAAADATGIEGGPYPLLYALTLELKADYNAHCADTTVHVHDDTTNTITTADPLNNNDLPGMIAVITELLTDYPAHLVEDEGNHVLYCHPISDSWNTLASVTVPIDEATCAARANDIKAKLNAHYLGNVMGWTEVAAAPGAGQFAVDYTNCIIDWGADPSDGNTCRFWYMSEGAATTEYNSTTGGTPAKSPSVVTHPGGSVGSGGYASIYVRSNLAGYSEERDRPFILVGRYYF